MADFSSNHGQILLALKNLAQDLQPEGLDDTEVEIRRSWLFNGEPFQGISVCPAGEQYDDGTVGTQDVGYLNTITFVKFRAGDAILDSDKDLQWYELIRRRLCDQRLQVTITNDTAPSEHVCIVSQGRDLTNERKWPNYQVRQLPVAVWLRELPTA